MKRNVVFAFLLLGCVALTLAIKAETVTQRTAAGIGPSFKGPLGLQLYSLREQFKKDVAATLDQVRAFGITNVELAGTYGVATEKFKQELDARQLKAVSAHFSYEQCRDHIEDIVRDAKLLGVEYAGCAWIPHKDPFDEKTCREAAAVFNRAGEALAKHGIKFFYHTHGYEFLPYRDRTLFDLLMSETKPEYVRIEMDVYWIVHPGQDPVKFLAKYGKRIELMHVKDMKHGTPGGFTGQSDVTNNVVLGQGIIDWPSVFRAAKKAGVKWYFIEDESPTSVEQIPQSLRYLEKLKF
ncbi:MAG TPA: sugar phosphate isomerase/epimerase [Pyrinomonadaceae bacterium]|jgi:sugar phosphate isomerase/epimerase|nr:sugar phosphate isomerase/epimerase [Pyrinomonadaceae bacterium]